MHLRYEPKVGTHRTPRNGPHTARVYSKQHMQLGKQQYLHHFQWSRPSVNPRAEDFVTGKLGARIGGTGEMTTAHFTRVTFQMQSFFSKIMTPIQGQLFWNCVNLRM